MLEYNERVPKTIYKEILFLIVLLHLGPLCIQINNYI